MAEIKSVTGIVLAGGRSSRFGSNKALALWNGGPLIKHTLSVLRPLFPNRMMVSKSLRDYQPLHLDVPLVRDGIERQHPMAGVLSGLIASETEWNFLCACDMPLLRTKLIEEMIAVSSGHDAVVPVWREKIQPLCGLYSKRCLPFIQDLLREDHAHCVDLYGRIRTRFFSEMEISRTDPEGLSFMDVDTPADFARALEKAKCAN